MNPIIEMKHICKYFPGVKALDDVSLTVQPGGNPWLGGRKRRREIHADENPFRCVYGDIR